MPASRLPLIRGRVGQVEFYQSPIGGGGSSLALPPRDPSKHRTELLQQLDSLARMAASRTPGLRDPDATRELIIVQPEPKYELVAKSLGAADSDVRVVGTIENGNVLVDAPSAALPHLRKKIEQYADDARLTPTGARAHASAIAPIAVIRHAAGDDLMGPRARAGALGDDEVRWFEIGCSGGVRLPAASAKSRGQIVRQLQRLGVTSAEEFLATEEVVFFCRLSLRQLRALIETTDCIVEFDLAPPEVRDWAFLKHQPVRPIQQFTLQAPAANSSSVVLLDTGIATAHPLLSSALLPSGSAIPSDSSAEDTHGHGTEMAGVALYGGDLGEALDAGSAVASHWIQSVRLLSAPQSGSASEENRRYWPSTTIAAVEVAERLDAFANRPRVFALATSSPMPSEAPSYWSHAIDRLAFNDAKERLLCVAIGNADTDDMNLVLGYPTMNLQQKAEDPSQAVNALTIGAFTEKVAIPPEAVYAEAKPVAPVGGISPHTRAGSRFGGAKPDVVLEGGNLGSDGKIPGAGIETLCTLTTGRAFLQTPLSNLCQTSEATSRAARLAALVWNAEPDLRPATVRALIVHSSSWTPAMLTQFPNLDERLRICGWGVPDHAFASACAAERATVVFEQEMANAIVVRTPKADRGQHSTATDKKHKRQVKLFRFPVPEQLLLDDPDREVELRVTLSYFPEPNTFRHRVSHGLDLKWDMQGPAEKEAQFIARINKLARSDEPKKTKKGRSKAQPPKSFPWELGITRRSRGTVQSDRWRGRASLLAGSKMIAVVPVLGWWERRPALRELKMPFSLVVSVHAAGLDVYNPIRVSVESKIEIAT